MKRVSLLFVSIICMICSVMADGGNYCPVKNLPSTTVALESPKGNGLGWAWLLLDQVAEKDITVFIEHYDKDGNYIKTSTVTIEKGKKTESFKMAHSNGFVKIANASCNR